MLESWHLLLTPYQDLSSWEKIGSFLTKVLSQLEFRNFKICEFLSSSSYSVNYYFEKITKSSLQTFRRIIQSVLQILLQWRRSGIFIVNFEHISHFVLLFLLFVNFEHVIAGWVFSSEISELVLFFILVILICCIIFPSPVLNIRMPMPTVSFFVQLDWNYLSSECFLRYMIETALRLNVNWHLFLFFTFLSAFLCAFLHCLPYVANLFLVLADQLCIDFTHINSSSANPTK